MGSSTSSKSFPRTCTTSRTGSKMPSRVVDLRVNPVSLCKRLQTLQAELVGLRREATTLTEAKQRAVLDPTRLLVANAQILQR